MENQVSEVVSIFIKLEGTEGKSYQKALEILNPEFKLNHPEWYLHRSKTGGDPGLLATKKRWKEIETAYKEAGGNASTFKTRYQRVYDLAVKTFAPQIWEQMISARQGKRERLTFSARVTKNVIPTVKAGLEDEAASKKDMDAALDLKATLARHGYVV